MKNGRFGVINREGEVIVDVEYDSVTTGDSFVCACFDEKYGLADKKGNVLFEPLYGTIDC